MAEVRGAVAVERPIIRAHQKRDETVKSRRGAVLRRAALPGLSSDI